MLETFNLTRGAVTVTGQEIELGEWEVRCTIAGRLVKPDDPRVSDLCEEATATIRRSFPPLCGSITVIGPRSRSTTVS
jgi:hypothetical protein